jgi:hypothetical protein
MVEEAILRDRVEKGVATKAERYMEVGMRGMTYADRYSVAVVWEAVRQRYLKETGDNDHAIQQKSPDSHEMNIPLRGDPRTYSPCVPYDEGKPADRRRGREGGSVWPPAARRDMCRPRDPFRKGFTP